MKKKSAWFCTVHCWLIIYCSVIFDLILNLRQLTWVISKNISGNTTPRIKFNPTPSRIKRWIARELKPITVHSIPKEIWWRREQLGTNHRADINWKGNLSMYQPDSPLRDLPTIYQKNLWELFLLIQIIQWRKCLTVLWTTSNKFSTKEIPSQNKTVNCSNKINIWKKLLLNLWIFLETNLIQLFENKNRNSKVLWLITCNLSLSFWLIKNN